MSDVIAAALNSPATYYGWGWLQISQANLIVILVMLLLFILAITLSELAGTSESAGYGPPYNTNGEGVAWFNAPDDATDFTATLTGGADAIIFYIMGLLSLGLLLLPFIPGLRSIPRWIPLHRLIWRQWYRQRRSPAQVHTPVTPETTSSRT